MALDDVQFAVKRVTSEIFRFFVMDSNDNAVAMPKGITIKHNCSDENDELDDEEVPIYNNEFFLTAYGSYTVFYNNVVIIQEIAHRFNIL